MNVFEKTYIDILKELVYNITIDEYKNLIEKAASLIKRVGMSDEELSDYMNEGLSKSLKRIQKGIDQEKWDETVKYGWIVDNLPFVILADDFKPYFENEDIEEFKDFNYYGRKFIDFFTYSFMSNLLEDLEWAKEIASQFPGIEIYK